MQTGTQNQLQLWLTPVQAAYEPAVLDRCARLLNAAETGRWQRLQYPADRLRFLLARTLVRTVLAEQLGSTDPAMLEFTHNAHGKPALDTRDGKLPLHFNLSHTDGFIVLAVCRSAAVGVDVESINRKAEVLALSSRYFSTTEHARLIELPEAGQREHFFRLWTLKEAWVKAHGAGLKIPLDGFTIRPDTQPPEISFGPQLNEDPANWQLHLFKPDAVYRIALAVQLPMNVKLAIRCFEGQPLAGFKSCSLPEV